MKYYIQGNAAKADQIRAAFESKEIRVPHYRSCGDNSLIYFSLNKEVLAVTIKALELFEDNPDYKELELPVELKFKVGDWVVIDNNHNSTYQVDSVRNYDYMLKHIYGCLMSFPFSSAERLRLWSHEDVRDGDVLVTTKIRSCPFIYRKTAYPNDFAYYYAGIDGNGDFCEGCIKRTLCHFGPLANVAPATKEQRALLFAKMREAGYKWDADKKELRKIQPHYDIANFKPFDKVLVRDDDNECWMPSLFGWFDSGLQDGNFVCETSDWYQCIPFNDDTKHLLGTTDMCDEMYINW